MEAGVHPQRLARLEAELRQINRHYRRAGVPAVRLIDTGRHDGPLVIVRLEAESASLGEWRIVCVLEHQAGRTVVRPCTAISEEQRQRLSAARGLCEACRTVRPRTRTYVLRDRATGRTVQVGSSCLRPYTGVSSPEAAIRRAEQLADIRAAVSAAATRRKPAPGERYIDTNAFLALAAAAVRQHGYAPASSPEPTWATALKHLQGAAEVSGQDLQRAKDVRDWAQARRTDDPGSYPSRRAACLDHDRLCSRELALAASAVPAYNRHLYRLIRHRRRQAARDRT